MSKFEVFQIVIGIFQGLATVLVAAVLYRQAHNLKRIEMHNQAMQTFNVLNSIALSSTENLVAFDSIGRASSADDDLSRRRRWCAFLWLETLQVTFTAQQSGMIKETYAKQALEQQLEVILRDDLVYWLVIHRGFDPSFAEYCTSIRLRVAPDRPVEFSEEEAIKGLQPSVSNLS